VSALPCVAERQRELAKAALRRQGLLGAPAPNPKPAPKRSVKFNKGYTALSQTADENLLSLDSDRCGLGQYPGILGFGSELSSPPSPLRFPCVHPTQRCCFPAGSYRVLLPLQVNQDLSRQLLQDGYHLDEVPDDEDLDLIPPKPVASSSCPCCFGDNLSCVIQ
ncbi:Protein FAM219B, partial [Nestor notabilis]